MLLMSRLFIMNIHKINYNSNAYPRILRDISSPPQPLFISGNQQLFVDRNKFKDSKWVAIVGTRKPTDYGHAIAYQLATELAAAGVIIVSGLAYGIDARAHQGAVDIGTPTVAVLAGGLDKISPQANQPLAIQIIKQGGAIISERPTGSVAYRQQFVARNRIISGLCDITVVVEADFGSGALRTANFARDQNREVMALPGAINSYASAGTNSLLKSGATIVTSSSDILDLLGKKQGLHDNPVRADSREEALILELIASGVHQSEELIARSNMSPAEFANLISLMEITGKVNNLGAGNWMSR